MHGHGPSLPSTGFLGRLKTHKVIEWTLAYAALAYTLLHGVEMVASALSWPHGIARVLTLVLILGVPVIATLAWYHGSRGLKRVNGTELVIITLLGVIAGAVLWGFARTSEEHQTTQAEHAVPTAPAAAATSSPAESTSTAATSPPSPPAPRTAVAVLPFVNLTGDASKEYLGDGMAEELINTLTKVQGLKVPARTSTFAYKGKDTDIRRIAKDLGVGTVLEGSVRAAGKRLRITAQLIDAQDGLHLWSENYDEDFTDIFKLQDKLAKAIAMALEPELAGTSAIAAETVQPTHDVEAYDLYLQGWSLISRPSPENLQRAIAYFQKALVRDPKFERAYAGLANAYIPMAMLYSDGTKRSDYLAAAERAARQALALDASSATAHHALAGVAMWQRQPVESESQCRAAVALTPNDGYVIALCSGLQRTMGHMKVGLANAQRAYALAPANPVTIMSLAGAYRELGRYAEASRYFAAASDLGYPTDKLKWTAELIALRSGSYAEAAKIHAEAFQDPREIESARLAYDVYEHPRQRTASLTAIARQFAAPADADRDAKYVEGCLDAVQLMAIVQAVDEAYSLASRCLSALKPKMAGWTLAIWSPEFRAFRRDPRFGDFLAPLGAMDYYAQYGPPDDCDLKNGKLTCH